MEEISYNQPMAKKEIKFCNLLVIFLAIFSAILILVGSFLDLEMAKIFYVGSNSYSIFFGLFGSLPLLLCFLLGGLFLFQKMKESKNIKVRIIGYILLFLIPLVSSSLMAIQSLDEYTQSLTISLLIAIPFSYLLLFGAWLIFRYVPSKNTFLLGIVLILGATFVFGFVHTINQLVGRPRYFALLEHGDFLFHHWWEWNSALVDIYPQDDPTWYRSFPSGHSACASLALLLPLPFFAHPKLKKYARWFYIPAFMWWLFTVVARLIDGHHFLSDVSFSLLAFSLVFLLLINPLLYRKNETFTKERRRFSTKERYLCQKKYQQKCQTLSIRKIRMMRNKRLH